MKDNKSHHVHLIEGVTKEVGLYGTTLISCINIFTPTT
jgi:hypothetical protein